MKNQAYATARLSLLSFAFLLACRTANANPITTNIAFTTNHSWTESYIYGYPVEGGAGIAAAPTTGNESTGVTFSDYNGDFYLTDPGTTDTINLSVALGTSSTVNTLFNTIFGSDRLEAIVTFYDSDGQTVVYDLTGGDVIRDYNSGSYQNDLSGTEPSYPGVTAKIWWSANGSSQHLDMQTFDLPASWNGTDLTKITIQNPNTQFMQGDPALSGLQVVSNPSTPSATPEPSSLALLGTALIAGTGLLRKRKTDSSVAL